jgi:hypothetical protein
MGLKLPAETQFPKDCYQIIMGLLYPPNQLPICLDGSEAICGQGPDFDKWVFKKESST